MSVGDRGADPPGARDIGDHAGSLLRLNGDGSVPDDNPFVGNDDAHPEIFSYEPQEYTGTGYSSREWTNLGHRARPEGRR